jgi:hypothetical protein
MEYLRDLVFAVSALLIALATDGASASDRIALVIGNGAYKNAPRLPNPTNDAIDVAAALGRSGFEVILATDLDKSGMDEAAIRFSRAARTADVAIFYYSGHALQFAGANYLLPIDTKLNDEADLLRMFRVDDIVGDLHQAKNLRILVLDACRDNPFADELKRSVAATRGVLLQQGLAKIENPEGMIVSYATQPGKTADDGDGRNSPFTSAFLKNIEAREEILTVFRHISRDVYSTTQQRQLPELSLSITGEFYLNGKLDITIKPDANSLQSRIKVDGSSKPPQAPVYLAISPGTVVRTSPTLRAAGLFVLEAQEKVIAEEEFDNYEHEAPLEDQNWVKITTDNSMSGYVRSADLLTPKQMEARKEWISKQKKLIELFDRSEKSSGKFTNAAGLYCVGQAPCGHKLMESPLGLAPAMTGILFGRTQEGFTWHKHSTQKKRGARRA